MPRKRQADDTASDVDVYTDTYAMELIELATNDEELRQRISDRFTSQLVPAWLNTTSNVRGFPSQIDFPRKELLVAKYSLPANDNEARLIRNRAAIDDLVQQNAVVLGPGSIQVRFDRRDSGVGMDGIENGGRVAVDDAEALGERQVVHAVQPEPTPPPFHPVNPTQPGESGSSLSALDVRLLELAVSDSDFHLRLNVQQIFHELKLSAPGWLNTTASVIGDPSRITEERFQALSEWVAPRSDEEKRLVRNRAAIMDLQAQILANWDNPPAHNASATAQVNQSPFPFVLTEQTAVIANADSDHSVSAVDMIPRGNSPDEADFIKLARNDEELFQRISTSEWLGRRDFQWPEWMSTEVGADGFPSMIEPARLQQLQNGNPPRNNSEHRFVRNHIVVLQIQAQIVTDVEIKQEPKEDSGHGTNEQSYQISLVSTNAHGRDVPMDVGSAKAIDLLSSHILEMEYDEVDDDLRFHFRNIEGVARANGFVLRLQLPVWLSGEQAPGPAGYPTQISPDRQQELREGHEPSDSIHERRFVRNLNAMMDVVRQIERRAAGVETIPGSDVMPRRPPTKGERAIMKTQRRHERQLVQLSKSRKIRSDMRKNIDKVGLEEGHHHETLATSKPTTDARPSPDYRPYQSDEVNEFWSNRLYVSNLAIATTEEDLKEFFKDYTVQDPSIAIKLSDTRPVACAYVHLSTSADAERAFKELNGKRLLNCRVSVLLTRASRHTSPEIVEKEQNVLTVATAKVNQKIIRTATRRIIAIQPRKKSTLEKASLRTIVTSGTEVLHEATTDEDIRQSVQQLASLHQFTIRLPDGIADSDNQGPMGYPDMISKDRRLLLEQGESASNVDEDRLLRNLAVAKYVEEQIQRRIEKRSRRNQQVKEKREAQDQNITTIKPTQERPQELRQALEALKVSDGQASTPPGSAPKEPQDSPQLPKQTASVDVERLKATALATFFQQIQQDSITITQLREENETLKATLAQPQQARKRKASMTPPSTSDEDDENARTYQPLANLVKDFYKALGEAAANESIQLCGLAPLQIISTRPQEVQQLAYDKLHTWRFDNVPPQWRRLHEDACLHIAAGLLKGLSTQALPAMNKNKRVKLGQDDKSFEAQIANIVKELDSAVIISGAPGRRPLIEATFRQLETIMRFFLPTSPPQQMVVLRSHELGIQDADLHSHIKRAPQAWAVDIFQVHLDQDGGPVIIPKSFLHWPACQKWQDLSYLKRNTLGGHRIVPVELGSSYTEEDWGSRFMTFNEYAEKYLLSAEPEEIGYLAQHNLFDQIPELRKDITIPDYCHTIPPPVRGAAAKTFGLDSVRQLDEPELNAWLGPKGTKTPLHTDAYHNILCQVVGYKYVRLYPPEQVGKLYPVGVDETGVNMSNTSLVDIWPFVPRRGEVPDHRKIQELREEFPLFETAEYQEAILGPGECLYIPLGWWHYVESLSTSFSVSFWWN